MAYIIKDDKAIATVDTDLKNGTEVLFAYSKCSENINKSRVFNLVNVNYGKISRAKKWDKFYVQNSAVMINQGEFFIH